MTEATETPATPEPPVRHKRRRSGTAAFHMSRQAVDVSLESLFRLTDKQAMELLVEARFGGLDTVRCPHCGSIGNHYWRPRERRWKCYGCDKTFSITSGTVFSGRKLSLQKLLAAMLTWINSAGGQPALELKRHLDTTYNTVFMLQHKLRESLVRGYNVGFLNGDLEIDGAHQSGRRAAEKRGKPQLRAPITPETPDATLDAAMMTQIAKDKERKRRNSEGKIDPEFGRRMPKDRRILITVRKRSGLRGRGAAGTRVAIGLVEDSNVAAAVMQSFVARPESALNTDTSPAYTILGRDFKEHRTVEHSARLVGPAGENNNQAEEFNWRYDRAEKGTYLNIEPKYMLDYACETAFRADTRRLSNGRQLRIALNVASSVGHSEWWRGFTRGHHRSVELTHPRPQPAPSSGPKKGSRHLSTSSKPPC